MNIFPGHTAVQSLYLSTDRAVDPKLLAAAYRFDAELARKTELIAEAKPKPARIRLKKHIVVALMAEEIIRIAASQGAVTLDDFKRLGLSEAQIEECKADAYGQAIAERPSLLPLIGGAA